MDRVNRIACKYGISESLLLSIHVNAAGNGSQWMNARGWCAYTFPGRTLAGGIANYLYAAAEKALPGQKIRKDMSDGNPDFESKFYILGHTACPAVLTENLFMDNLEDYRFLMSAAGKKAIIDLHVNGICNYLKSFE